MGRPGFRIGILVGVLLTAPLIALMYLSWRGGGLPFVPFDLFDWITRILPGRLIGLVIDTMVTVIRALHLGPTASTAKLAEQSMAIAQFFVAGVLVAGVFFVILRRWQGMETAIGAFLALLMGVPIAWLSAFGRTASIAPWESALWVLALFFIWGALLGWIYQRLAIPSEEGEAARVQALNRRQFLVRVGGASATLTVAGAVVGALASSRREPGLEAAGEPWSAAHPLPNADAPVKPVRGTRRELTPVPEHYRIDINTFPPTLSESTWRLHLSGLVERPLALTLEEIRSRWEPLHQFITLECISNPVAGDLIGTQRWTGVSLQRLLPDLHLKPNATHLKITGADGFYEYVDLKTIRDEPRVMLTYAWDGLPLLSEHGFPLRIYIPDRFGMKQPKWIQSIEAIDHAGEGYWVERGWDREARMRATSVIDVVASNMMIIEGNRKMAVPLGGIAFAGARGISKVQVRTDEGAWQDAQLRTPLSGTTWVIWRYDWPFRPGKHTFTVRCSEGNGTPQIAAEAPPAPSGATGLHSESVML